MFTSFILFCLNGVSFITTRLIALGESLGYLKLTDDGTFITLRNRQALLMSGIPGPKCLFNSYHRFLSVTNAVPVLFISSYLALCFCLLTHFIANNGLFGLAT